MIFVDSSNPREIEEIYALGIASGVTTNPLILAKDGVTNIKRRVEEILIASFGFDHPVSIQVTCTTEQGMISQAEEYMDYNPRIIVKLPFSQTGLRVAKVFKGRRINMTALMSAQQTLIAMKSKADYCSIFAGRIRDLGNSPASVIEETYKFRGATTVIVGSIRHPADVTEAFTAGADIVTIPPDIIKKMIYHPRTESTIDEFNDAYTKMMLKDMPVHMT